MSASVFPSLQCAQQSVGAFNTMVSTLLQTLLAAQCAISPTVEGPSITGLTTYDFVIVGAGTAGSVIASRLSENPDWKVLLLEAGGDPPVETQVPSLFSTVHHTNYTWNYYTEPDGKSCLAFENQVCYWPRGKMMGGTGEINGMVYVRENRQDYDMWKRRGNPNWGWDDVLPVFENSLTLGKSNETVGITAKPFGTIYPEIREMLLKGGEELGYPILESVQEGADLGFTELPGNIENGRRSSTRKSYLLKSQNRPNLHVIKKALVTKINFDEKSKTATGVNFIYLNKYQLTVNVSKEVILSAGSLDSPKVLMLSGIGPQKHLDSLNIQVIQNSRVGDNLQDHVGVAVIFKLTKTNLPRATPKDVLDSTYTYLLNQTGTLATTAVNDIAGFINSDEDSSSPYPDVENQNFFMASGSNSFETWKKSQRITEKIAQSIRSINERNHVLVTYVMLLRPKSTGALRLQSANPYDSPRFFANYFAHPKDKETLLRGIKFQMETEQTSAYKEQGAEIVQISLPECDRFLFKSDKYWKCYMKYMTMALYHPVGTVKMGSITDKTAVVDSLLRVKGVKRLRVADGSIMPNIVSGNTNAPIAMIAERAAEFIKEEWS